MELGVYYVKGKLTPVANLCVSGSTANLADSAGCGTVREKPLNHFRVRVSGGMAEGKPSLWGE